MPPGIGSTDESMHLGETGGVFTDRDREMMKVTGSESGGSEDPNVAGHTVLDVGAPHERRGFPEGWGSNLPKDPPERLGVLGAVVAAVGMVVTAIVPGGGDPKGPTDSGSRLTAGQERSVRDQRARQIRNEQTDPYGQGGWGG